MRLFPTLSDLLRRPAVALAVACALNLGLICPLLVSGCSTNPPPPQTVLPPVASDLTNVVANANDPAAGCESTGALHELWQQRSQENNSSAYPVGPGDILQVTVTDLPEINKLNARVNGEGIITLPVIGELKVAGLSEEDAAQLIIQKARLFVRDPRVHVFAQHFAGRNVNVMGMVALPGTYPLNGPSESILSILGRAGGLKGNGEESAAQRVVLFPANTGSRQSVLNPEAALQKCAVNQTGIANAKLAGNSGNLPGSTDPFGNDPSGPGGKCAGAHSVPGIVEAKTTDPEISPGQVGASVMPIIIDLSKPSMASCLNLPARPGDIILVPAAGQVGVYGWVKTPGQLNITPGMTVLSAITGAGGAMFSSNVELLRTSRGTRISKPLDLSQIEHGQEPDLAVQSGDVIVVQSSAAGALPYGVYTLLTKFGTGMYLTPGM